MKPAESAPPALPTIGPADRLGAVVPVPAATTLEGADLRNVIVLAHRRNASGIDAPAVTVTDTARPVPAGTWRDRTPWTALIAGALLLHLGLVVMFMRDPVPMPSLALDSISVDIILGGQTEAGVAQLPSSVESAPSPPTESAPQATEQPPDIEEQKPELRPRIETAEPQPEEKPREQMAEEPKPKKTQAATSEPTIEAAEPEPTPAPAEAAQSVAAAAEVDPTPKAPEPEKTKPVEEPVTSRPPPKEQPTETPREQSKPTPPRVAASQSGVGVGSSRETRDWASRVSAHLARNKRYPADALASGIGGTASVAFTLDSGGRVTSVRLVRSSGNASLDRESQDLVRRASPFPPPPNGRASITVPVNYNVRAAR
ncbi:energy transducer TonB [Pseudorhodoplanes sp.]|uniref:energy transducer TonB n=1 Tax=Pseudorhodoplanes sp. TaxID=1934341 RepID=UPI002CDC6403|nr:energy transducer TonB [Pseudorhodoplanes sp.]HWV55781.1 energy transducer TonB [Pseudorhodoplanes sp.]